MWDEQHEEEPPAPQETEAPLEPPVASGSDGTVMKYEDAFELTGHGLFNHIALVACSLIFMHSLIEMVATAYVLDPAMCDLKFTISEKSAVASGIFIGIVATSICWGTLSDHFGRRKVMLPALICACIFSFSSSMCSTFWGMFLLRIMTGIMVSASFATVLVYLGELNNFEHRDVAISIAVASVAVVFCLVPVFAWIIVPRKFSFNIATLVVKPWRVFMWTWSLIGLVGAGFLFILPESPSFILASKGPFFALPILRAIYAMNHRKDGSDYPVTSVTTSTLILHSGDTGIKGTIDDMLQLVKPPMLLCFLLTHFAMFMVFLLANGIYLWTPSIFNMILEDTSLDWTVCDILQSAQAHAHSEIDWFHHETDYDFALHGGGMNCTTQKINEMMYLMAFGMEIVLLIPFLIVTAIIHKYNKVILYLCVMGPCAIFLALSVLVPEIVVSGGIFLTLGLCSGSSAGILTAMAVDAFPTSLRALAMCTMYMMGQVGAVIGNILTSLSVTGPCIFLFLMQAALVAASAIFLLLFWPNLDNVRLQMEARGFTY